METWYSRDDIQSAEHWERSIKAGLEACDWFVLVMSPNAVTSEWVKDELHWAIEHRADRIIPVLIAPCSAADLHIRLPRVQQVDFVADPDGARNRLVTLLVDAEFRPIRASTVNGRWLGRIHQHKGPNGAPLDYGVELILRTQRHEIKGDLKTRNPLPDGPRELDFRLSGGFFHERFLQIVYMSKNPSRIQFGSVILQLDDTGLGMEGMFIGYGAWSKTIIGGDLKLSRAG